MYSANDKPWFQPIMQMKDWATGPLWDVDSSTLLDQAGMSYVLFWIHFEN